MQHETIDMYSITFVRNVCVSFEETFNVHVQVDVDFVHHGLPFLLLNVCPCFNDDHSQLDGQLRWNFRKTAQKAEDAIAKSTSELEMI